MNNKLDFLLKYLLLLIVAMGMSNLALSQQTITGVVTDSETGDPLIRASIRALGTEIGTFSEADGSYSLTVPDGATELEFSYVGYGTQRVSIGTSNIVNIELSSDNILDEVVIVGYGTERKSDLTGAVSSLKPGELLRERPVTSIDQLLQGTVAGVNFSINSGAPGAQANISIRGVGSLGSTQPLFVIDGFPLDNDNQFGSAGIGDQQQGLNPLAMLNPNDIESIEVLKDASATAIYGSRGANGVILVTTKSGQNQGGKISYNFRFDISEFPQERKIDVLGTEDWLNYRREGQLKAGEEPDWTEMQIDSIVALGIDNDWQDQIYQTGYTQDHQLSFTGGDDVTKYALTLGYTDVDGVTPNSNLTRYSGRLNLSRRMNNWLSAKANLSYSRSKSNQIQQASQTGQASRSVVLAGLLSPPTRNLNPELQDDDFIENPVLLAEEVLNDFDLSTLLGKVQLDMDLFPGMVFSNSFNFNSFETIRNQYLSRVTFNGDAEGGRSNYSVVKRFTFESEHLLRFNRQLFKGHRLNSVVGFTYREGDRETIKNQTSGFLNDNLTYFNPQGGTVTSGLERTRVVTQLASFLGRVNYSINGKYNFTVSGRYDGTNRLAEKWSFFPSGAAAWNMHEELFLKNVKSVSRLKLRASYGVTGRESVPPLSGVSTLISNTAIVGNQFVSALFAQSNALGGGSLGNPNLKWESTTQYNVGVDLGMFDNQLRLSVDLFRRNTENLLVGITLPFSAAFENTQVNAGEIQNEGIEIELGADIVKGDNFSWGISGTFTSVRNEVVDLGDIELITHGAWINAGDIALGSPLHITQVGSVVGAYYGYLTDGIYQNQEEINAGPEPGASPGDVRYKDVAGDFDADGNPIPDGQITPDDLTIIGDAIPDFIFGIANNFSYKNFSLSFFFQGSVGNDVINLNRYITDGLSSDVTSRNVRQEAYDNRWQGEGTTNTFPAISAGPLFDQRPSDFWVEDGTFLRLRNITIGYKIPFQANKIIRSARLFVTGSNLLLWTNYTGYDPEASARNVPTQAGVDFGVSAQPRVYSIGANLEF
ncbi:MAG: TonB-dependent receptor [Bacteroidota bacterium]